MKFKKLCLVVCLLFFSQINTGSIYKYQASEQNIGSCIDLELTSQTSSVLEGFEIQINLNYQTNENSCSLESLVGDSVVIDFSQLVTNGDDISYTIDEQLFDISISSSGVVTLTIKSVDTDTESAIEYGGILNFDMLAKEVDNYQAITVSDNWGNVLNLTILNDTGTIVNTNKVSVPDYAQVGDTVEYMVMINGDNNYVENFKGIDTHSAGMQYVPGSLYVQEDFTWVDKTDYFTATLNPQGDLVIENTQPFDSRMLIYYKMEITSQNDVYTNNFEANYDSSSDTVSDDVWYELEGGGWIDYTHGNIEIQSQDNDGNAISNAKFEIRNEEGDVVDNLITDENGYGISSNLPLGNYSVTETVAPNGYKLDETDYPISIVANDRDMKFEINSTHEAVTGNITVNAVNESGKSLAGAEFEIRDSTGAIVDQMKTVDNEGATSIDLECGEYIVQETKAPSGYKLDEKQYPVTISSSKLENEVISKSIKNSTASETEDDNNNYIEIHLTNSAGESLGNASFGIYDSSGNLVEVVVTDENGNAKSKYLTSGEYYVQQLGGVDGYLLDDEKYWFTIGGARSSTKYEIVNEKSEGYVTINNLSTTGQPIAESGFNIYNESNELIETLTTDASGVAKSSKLEAGSYYVKQVSTPDDYMLDNNKYNFNIEQQNQNINIEVINGSISTPLNNDNIVGNMDLEVTGSKFIKQLMISGLVLCLMLIGKYIYVKKT